MLWPGGFCSACELTRENPLDIIAGTLAARSKHAGPSWQYSDGPPTKFGELLSAGPWLTSEDTRWLCLVHVSYKCNARTDP